MKISVKTIGSALATTVGVIAFAAYEIHGTMQDFGIQLIHSCTVSAIPASSSPSAQAGGTGTIYITFSGDKAQTACDYMVNNGQGLFLHADNGPVGSQICSIHDTNPSDLEYGLSGDVYGDQNTAQLFCNHMNNSNS